MSFAYLFERFPSFVQTFCHREAEEMARQGMNPLVLSVRRPDDPPELTEPLDLEVLYLPEEKTLRAEVDRDREKLPRRVRKALARGRQGPDSQRLFEAVWLGPLLRERGLRHVHAHFGGLATRTAWWLRKLYGVPYSFTGHANDIFCENDFPVTNAQLVRDAVFVVTETDFARRWMEEKYPFARGKVFRVFNGIDIGGFLPRRPPGVRKRVLSVGRYVEKKGFSDLIEACRLGGGDFECLIVGGGPLHEPLQRQIESAGLGGRVQLLGPRPQREVRELLAGADLFVLACVPEAGGGTDNLPTVIMEAMAAGVPVLSTRLTGVPEMITDGVDGRLVVPGAPAELAAAIAELLAAPAEAARLAAAGQETARTKFALAQTARELKRLLLREAAVTPPPEALRLDPDLARERPAFGRRLRLAMKRFFLLGLALCGSGCFVVKDAVVDTVKVGAYAAKETTHVAARTTVMAAKATVKGGQMAAHAVSQSAAEASAATAPAAVAVPAAVVPAAAAAVPAAVLPAAAAAVPAAVLQP